MDERTTSMSSHLLDESSIHSSCIPFQIRRTPLACPTSATPVHADKAKKGKRTRGENVVKVAKSDRTQTLQGVLATSRHMEPEVVVTCGFLSSPDSSREGKTESSTVAATDVNDQIRRRQSKEVKKNVSLIRMYWDWIKPNPFTAKQWRP